MSRMGSWLDPCIIWEESGQGEGTWVCGSCVLHLWVEYTIQLETHGAARTDPDLLHPSSYSPACPAPSVFTSPVLCGPLEPAEPCGTVMADCVGSPGPLQPWRGFARHDA